MRQIILDTETTGLEFSEGHRIIEIGAIELVNRKFTGKRFHQYINPERQIDEGALSVHGISQEFLADKPVFADIVETFLEFIKGAELVIHNAPFDVGFIDHEFSLADKKFKTVSHHCKILDTLPLARQLHIGQRNSLDALCKRYGVDNSQREFHGALLDCHLLAQVYLAMTGGQGSLFDEPASISATVQLDSQIVTEKKMVNRQLRVIKASIEELTSHKDQLEKMQQKGKCLWVE